MKTLDEAGDVVEIHVSVHVREPVGHESVVGTPATIAELVSGSDAGVVATTHRAVATILLENPLKLVRRADEFARDGDETQRFVSVGRRVCGSHLKGAEALHQRCTVLAGFHLSLFT